MQVISHWVSFVFFEFHILNFLCMCMFNYKGCLSRVYFRWIYIVYLFYVLWQIKTLRLACLLQGTKAKLEQNTGIHNRSLIRTTNGLSNRLFLWCLDRFPNCLFEVAHPKMSISNINTQLNCFKNNPQHSLTSCCL